MPVIPRFASRKRPAPQDIFDPSAQFADEYSVAHSETGMSAAEPSTPDANTQDAPVALTVKAATARRVARQRFAKEEAAQPRDTFGKRANDPLPSRETVYAYARTDHSSDFLHDPAEADSRADGMGHTYQCSPAPFFRDSYDTPPEQHFHDARDLRPHRRIYASPFSSRLFPVLCNILLVAITVLVCCVILLLIRIQRGEASLFADNPAPDGSNGASLPVTSESPLAEQTPPAAGIGDAPEVSPVQIELPTDMTPIPIDAPSPTPVAVLEREPTDSEKLAAFIYEGLSRFYTRDELIYRSEEELAMIRNGMYALSGKIFERNMEAKDFFESCSWYEGTTTSDSSAMSNFSYYQLQNLQLIIYVEKDKGFRSR